MLGGGEGGGGGVASDNTTAEQDLTTTPTYRHNPCLMTKPYKNADLTKTLQQSRSNKTTTVRLVQRTPDAFYNNNNNNNSGHFCSQLVHGSFVGAYVLPCFALAD